MALKKEYLPKLDEAMKRLNAPFFFYDLDHLKSRLNSIKAVLHPDVKLWYACKANPMSAILKVLRNQGHGIDVASKGELFQVLNTGIEASQILATGPGKSQEYLGHLLDSGVKIIILEGHNQLLWLEAEAAKRKMNPTALLRVQLEWPEGESVLGGNAITPFGISEEDWQEFDFSQINHVNLKGFHAFQWGNILEISRLQEIWEYTIQRLQALSEKIQIPCDILDLGGGLGIPYTADKKEIAFSDVHQVLMQLKEKYQLKKIWLELGRYTIGESGYYFTKIIDKKIVRGAHMLVTEGGINHIARPAITKESFPCSLYRDSQAEKVKTIVHGPLCTAMDRLGEFDLPDDVKVGDWLVFSQTGAYGFTESMPYFLCHALAGEVIYYNGDLMIPRPTRESYYDWPV